ncbi:MAG: MazG family protein [Actinobacteria bacterium]|nr:MazG family protein [Actinomycetota bacterium]
MDILRSPGGCPWDAEQTHNSLLEYLIEESHELIEAIETGNRIDLREELGDVLLQVVFHARIAMEDESDPFNLDEVAEITADKLMSRHPHVFADQLANTAQDVEAIWHQQKMQEKGRKSLLDGIPRTLPALMLATKMLKRTKQYQIDIHSIISSETKVKIKTSDEIGKALFDLVKIAREHKIDPEAALRQAIREYEDKVLEIEVTNQDES